MPKAIMFTSSNERPAKTWGNKKGPIPTEFEVAIRATLDSEGSVCVSELPHSDNYVRKHFEACYPELKLAIRKKGERFHIWAEKKSDKSSEAVTDSGIEFAGE